MRRTIVVTAVFFLEAAFGAPEKIQQWLQWSPQFTPPNGGKYAVRHNIAPVMAVCDAYSPTKWRHVVFYGHHRSDQCGAQRDFPPFGGINGGFHCSHCCIFSGAPKSASRKNTAVTTMAYHISPRLFGGKSHVAPNRGCFSGYARLTVSSLRSKYPLRCIFACSLGGRNRFSAFPHFAKNSTIRSFCRSVNSRVFYALPQTSCTPCKARFSGRAKIRAHSTPASVYAFCVKTPAGAQRELVRILRYSSVKTTHSFTASVLRLLRTHAKLRKTLAVVQQ